MGMPTEESESAGFEDKLNLTARIDRLPMTRYLVLFIVAAGMGYFFDIFDISAISGTIPVIASQFHLDPLTKSIIIALPFIGMFFGSITSGYLSDKYGRKNLFIYTLLIIVIGSLLTAFSQNFTELAIFMVITGIGVGGDLPIIWSYVSELLPTKVRGKWMSFIVIFTNSAFPMTLLASLYLVPYSAIGWRFVFIIGALIGVAIWPLRNAAPESPRFYKSRGLDDRAEQSMSSIEKRVEKEYGRPLPPVDPNVKTVITQTSSPLKDIFKRKYAASLTLATLVWILQTWAFYGLTVFLPTILLSRGYTLVHSILYSLVGEIGGIIAPILLFFYLAEHFERKYTVSVTAFLGGILAVTLAYVSTILLIVSVTFFLYIFTEMFYSAYVAYTPEIFPTKIRSTASGFANAFGRGSNLIGTLVIGVALAANYTGQLLFIGLSWIGVAIVVIVLGVKTTGKKLEEISS
jgi:putative MFS transporter